MTVTLLLESLTIYREHISVDPGANLAEIITADTLPSDEGCKQKPSMGNGIGQNTRINRETPTTETKA
jgi:hypothetical protein